jgi:hypothetical protein
MRLPAQPCGHATAIGAKRRSDQSSRRMFGRRTAQAVGPEIIFRPQHLSGSRKRIQHGRRRGGQARDHATRHEHAFVAVDRHRRLGRAARHAVRHLGHHGHIVHGHVVRGHIVRHRHIRGRRHRCIRSRAGHHRPGERRQYQSHDHGDREQAADGGLTGHVVKIAQKGSNW